MMGMKRRAYLSILALTALWSVTATCLLVNHRQPQAMPAQAEIVSSEIADPMTQFRTEREQLRQMEKSQLNDIIYNASGDGEAASMARRQLLSLMDCEAKEQELEGILKIRGFQDVLAVVRDDTANILVRGSALSQRENAIILDLVLRQTGISGGNVKIIPIK